MSERRQKDMDEKEAAFLQHAREFAEHMRNGRQRTREDWKRYEKAAETGGKD